jgi:hypothetical protein
VSPDNQTLGNEVNLQEIIDIPMGGKKNIIFDATVLTSLMACGRLTDFRFNLNLQSINGKSNSLECGSMVHVFMEYFYRALINGVRREQAVGFGMAAAELYIRGCPSCSGFKPSCNHNHAHSAECGGKPMCGHKVDEFPGVHNTPKDSTDKPRRIGWQHVLDTCDQYQKFYINDSWVPLEVEVVKGEVLYEDDEIRILWKAKLDLVVDTNQGVFPEDHKTMSQNRDTNSMNNQFMGQCILMKTRQVLINKVGFQTSLKPEEKFKRTPIPYTPARLMEWQSETLPYYAKLLLMYAETGHWPPNFTHCESKYGNCAFYENVCSGDPGMREENLKLNFMVGPEWNPTNEEE